MGKHWAIHDGTLPILGTSRIWSQETWSGNRHGLVWWVCRKANSFVFFRTCQVLCQLSLSPLPLLLQLVASPLCPLLLLLWDSFCFPFFWLLLLLLLLCPSPFWLAPVSANETRFASSCVHQSVLCSRDTHTHTEIDVQWFGKSNIVIQWSQSSFLVGFQVPLLLGSNLESTAFLSDQKSQWYLAIPLLLDKSPFCSWLGRLD